VGGVIPDPPSTTTTTTTPTTTTTTTTTPKPAAGSRGGAAYRGKRPHSTSQSSSSQSQSVQDGEEEIDDSQNAINRRQSPTTWTRGQTARAANPLLLPPQPSPTSVSVTVTSSTSESLGNGRSNRQQYSHQTNDAPVVTVKSSNPPRGTGPPPPPPPQQQQQQQQPFDYGKPTEASIIKTRPSRFWQRPAKVVASSTTTEAPVAVVADYSDYSDFEEVTPSHAPLRQVTVAQVQPQKSRYRPSSQSQSSSSTSSHNSQDREPYSNTYRGQYTNSAPGDQYLRQAAPSQGQRSQHQQHQVQQPQQSNYFSQFGPSPSSIGFTYNVPSSSSSRPEFISLLRDDEDPYYDVGPTQIPTPSTSNNNHLRTSSSNARNVNINNRRPPQPPPPPRTQYYSGPSGPFRHSQTNLYGAAQETFHTFLPAPSGYPSPFVMRDLGLVVPVRRGSDKVSFDVSMLGGK
jgi:hypothetical protein